jgi:hypothetical protein
LNVFQGACAFFNKLSIGVASINDFADSSNMTIRAEENALMVFPLT